MRRRTTLAAVVVMLLVGWAIRGAPAGRAEVDHPVAGVAAVIDASAPRDDVFNGQFCGGTLVAPSLVLTAAHCVAAKRPAGIEVVIGADNLCHGEAIDGERVAVRGIFLHREYNAESRRFDLALLALAARFPDAVRTVAAPPSGRVGHLTALGWGRASSGGVPACRLMRVELGLLDAERCADAIGQGFDEASMICALPEVAGRDACIGDSGGPILIGSNLDDAAILGVVSWGRGCGAGVPGVYARADRWRQAVSSALSRPSRIRSSPYSNSSP